MSIALTEQGILKFVGIEPIRETLIGVIGSINEAKRTARLEKLKALGASGS